MSVKKIEVPMTILIAEDNAMLRDAIGRMLQYLGCTVDLAEHGGKAVEAAAQRDYDLIFMDLNMPEVDGCEATMRIRQHEAGTDRRVPIVAMTGADESAQLDRRTEAGMDGFLGKPATFDDLSTMVHRWIPKSESARDEAAAPRQAAPASSPSRASDLVDPPSTSPSSKAS